MLYLTIQLKNYERVRMKILKNIILKKIVFGNEVLLNNASTFHIAFGIDNNFIIGTGVLIYSILQQTKHNISFHIFTDSISDDDIFYFKSLCTEYSNIIVNIYYLNPQKFNQLPTFYIWSKAIYYRFLISKYLSSKIDIVLYLDSDILCLNNFDSLFQIDLKKYIACVVPDNPYMLDYAKINFNLQTPYYFNSGFMLINLKNWEENHISEQAFKLLTQKNKFKYFDQDVLNILLANKTIPLEKKYNTIYRLADMRNSISENTIFLHYTGSTKPWQAWGQYHKLTPLWLNFKNNSPWKNIPIMQPKTYKQAKFMAKNLKRNNKVLLSFKWYLKYSLLKIKAKI